MSTSEELCAARQEEFFGVAPNCLVDDIYNAVDDFISDAVDSLECHVAKEMRIGEEGPRRRTLTQGADKLLMHMREACEVNFDKFELYVLRNIFSLPDDLELPSQSPVVQLSLDDVAQDVPLATHDDGQSPSMDSPSDCASSDPSRFFADMKELDCELAVLLGRLKTESSKRNQYTKTLRDLKDTLTFAQSHVDSDALAALDPKKVRVVIEAAANMRAAANRLQDIQRGMGRSSNGMPEERNSVRGNNNNNNNKAMGLTDPGDLEEQHVSAGETLAHEMKDLQRSFGSPSVEVLRNLMECL